MNSEQIDLRHKHGLTRPKFGSKRWHELKVATNFESFFKCATCGIMLVNPLSILLHRGRICEKSKIKRSKPAILIKQ